MNRVIKRVAIIMFIKKYNRMRTICYAIFSASLFLSNMHAESKLLRNLEAGEKQQLVVYGTSLTANGGWVKELEAEFRARYPGQFSLVNSGGAGKWSEWGLQNLDSRVLRHHPDTVFLEFSINDCVARFNCTPRQSSQNLEQMIEHIWANNRECEIILMTMTVGDKYPEGHRSYRKRIDPYYEAYRHLAKEYDLLLIEHYPNWCALKEQDASTYRRYVPDSIHPTVEGNFEIVTPVILKALMGDSAG